MKLNLGKTTENGLLLDLKVYGVNGKLILLCGYPSNLNHNTRKRIHHGLTKIRRLFVVPTKTRRNEHRNSG